MSDFYKILKADPLGDPWTPKVAGAKPIQNYWCQVEGLDKDVSIGKQVREDGQPALFPGQQVYGDLVYAKSQRGTEYWKFKSQQVPEDVERPANTPAQATAQAATRPPVDMSATQPDWFQPWGNMITYIYNEMKKMDADAPAEEPTPEPVAEEPAKVEQLGGEPLDEETKKTLDDIFTPPESPDEVPEDK